MASDGWSRVYRADGLDLRQSFAITKREVFKMRVTLCHFVPIFHLRRIDCYNHQHEKVLHPQLEFIHFTIISVTRTIPLFLKQCKIKEHLLYRTIWLHLFADLWFDQITVYLFTIVLLFIMISVFCLNIIVAENENKNRTKKNKIIYQTCTL